MVVANVSVYQANASPLNPDIYITASAEIRRDRTASSGFEATSSVTVSGVTLPTGSGKSLVSNSTVSVVGSTDVSSSTFQAERAYGDYAIADRSTGSSGFSEHGNIIESSVERKRKFGEIEVTWMADVETLENLLRPLNKYPGKYETIEQEDGGYSKIDISPSSSNTYTLIPPDDMSPPMREKEVLISGYKEKLASDTTYEVSIKFAPSTEDSLTGNELQESYTGKNTEWKFIMSDSTIVTGKVTLDTKGKISNSTSTFKLTMILNADQTETLQNNASKAGAVDVWDVDEGVNYLVDNNNDNRNTVYIQPPDTSFVSNGYYAISDWKYTSIGLRQHEVQIDIIAFPDSGEITNAVSEAAQPLSVSTTTESLIADSETATGDIETLVGNSQFLNSEIMNIEAEITDAATVIKRPNLIINVD